jgi:hypothetical protein
MEKKNKEFFANACVVACNKMCAQAEYLMPEINVASIVEQVNAIGMLDQIFSLFLGGTCLPVVLLLLRGRL